MSFVDFVDKRQNSERKKTVFGVVVFSSLGNRVTRYHTVWYLPPQTQKNRFLFSARSRGLLGSIVLRVAVSFALGARHDCFLF